MKNYIVDRNTDNRSFIETCKLLKEENIQNNDFFLRLYDESLSQIDPYDINLTDDIKIKIINECNINPYYYLREVINMRCHTRYLSLNTNYLSEIYCILNGIDYCVNRTISNYDNYIRLATLSWLFNFGLLDSNMLFYKNSWDLVNLNIFNNIIDNLPDYIKRKFTDNKLYGCCTRLVNKNNNNNLNVRYTREHDPIRFYRDRPINYHIQFFDSFDITKYNNIILASSNMVYTNIKSEALKRNSISCRIFIPSNINNDIDTPKYDYYKDTIAFYNNMINSSYIWHYNKLFDMDISSLKEFISKHSSTNMIVINYN
jgi:hypothetical protein